MKKDNKIRQIFYYKDYYLDFFKSLSPDVQRKFNWTLGLIEEIDRVPKKYFDHITGSDGLYEIRVEVGSNIFRVFSCFDEGKLIILFNGFKKKTPKTPKSEIEFATKIKKEYFYEKEK